MSQHNSPTTFFEWLEFYKRYCLGEGQSPSTIKNKAWELLFFFKWCFANNIKSPFDVTKQVGLSFKVYLAEYTSPQTTKPLKLSTRRKRLTVVRTFFESMADAEVINTNPLAKLKLPKVPRTLPTAFLSRQDLNRVRDETLPYGLIGLRDRAIIECFYAAGIRRAEMCDLDINHIDDAKLRMFVKDGKGDKDRYIPISMCAVSWVNIYLKSTRPILASMKSGLALFVNNQGERFKPNQMGDLMKKYLDKAGVDVNAACNTFRHTSATHLLENGADIRHIQKYLGHADLSTTQIYTHVVDNKLDEVYNKCHPSSFKDKAMTKKQMNNYLN